MIRLALLGAFRNVQPMSSLYKLLYLFIYGSSGEIRVEYAK